MQDCSWYRSILRIVKENLNYRLITPSQKKEEHWKARDTKRQRKELSRGNDELLLFLLLVHIYLVVTLDYLD